MATEDDAKTITAADWKRHEDEILDLFVSQEKTLREVMDHMRNKHGFDATARQYKHRFPRLKNVSEDEWVYINEERDRRAALGKKSVVCLHGKPLSQARVDRGIARIVKKGSNSITKRAPKRRKEDRISFRTPPVSPAPRPSERLDSYAAPRVPSGELGGTFDPLIEQAVPSPAFASDPEEAPGTQFLESGFTQDQLMWEWSTEWPGTFDLISRQASTGPDDVDMFDFERSNATIVTTSGRVPTDHLPVWQDMMASTPRSGFTRRSSGSSHLGFPSFIEHSDFALPGTHLGDSGLTRNLPLFRVLSTIEQPGYPRQRFRECQTSHGFLIVVRSALSESTPEFHSTLSISEVALQLQPLVPERHEGDLSNQVRRIWDCAVPGALPALFALTAFFASNNVLEGYHMDAFLRWIVAQGYQDSLTQFVRDIQGSTTHALAKILLESAIRIKNVPVVNTLLDCCLKLDGKLLKIASIGDISLTWRVLSNIDHSHLAEETGADLLGHFVSEGQFELAQHLLANGVPPDAQSAGGTALCRAVDRRNMEGIEFILKAGADVNAIVRTAPGYYYRHGRPASSAVSALGHAVLREYAEIVKLLLDHGANVFTTIDGESLTGWAALHCRSILGLLEKHLDPGAVGFLLGDLVEAAIRGPRALEAYIAKYPGSATTHQLERALEESIKGRHVTAAVTLLQHGVNPNGPTLEARPLVTAIGVEPANPEFAELLLEYNADVQQPGVLRALARTRRSDLLNKALASPIDTAEGIEALVDAAIHGNIVSAAALIQAGVDFNMPPLSGRLLNPLQIAALSGYEAMVLFLISQGADVNAPAHPNGGRTALQSALWGEAPIEVGDILLHHGADISAPPALLDGITALEAFCNNDEASDEAFCHKLIDAGATVNRPGGKPSSAVHGVVRKKWHRVLRRLLKPPHNAIVDHMWYDNIFENDPEWEPRTPTQLAADLGDLEALKILLAHGSSVNEAPGPRFGRTALQAASSRTPGLPKTTLIHFLLDYGADIHAAPAPEGGITALQGAAISGDLILARLLINRGADVNAWPSVVDGRTAIEGAAEHGRLDMVQLLLNAGAKGDVIRGKGLAPAIALARHQGHFAIASMLETAQAEQHGMSGGGASQENVL